MKIIRSSLYPALLIGLLAAWLIASPALAHHGWTGYDASKTLTATAMSVGPSGRSKWYER